MPRSTADDRLLTALSAGELARRIGRGEVSSSRVVEAHLERIAAVEPGLNAVTVLLAQAARAGAAAADDAVRRGSPLGPLHGVPVTVKELFDVAGTPTTAGLASRRELRAERDASVVASLRRTGAIVLAKTNVPQLAMLPETDNPVHGRTNNPWNPARSPGGSSGGEAAIIAARGSPLGVGSDGGGSVRLPCHAVGIHGLKPTSGRLSNRGHWAAPNFRDDWLQPGPMARSVDDLLLALRVLASDPREPGTRGVDAPALRDPAEIEPRALRVGVYEELCGFSPSPAVRRVVREAAEHLRAEGATVVPFVPPDVDDAWGVYLRLFHADGMRWVMRETAGSPVDGRIRRILGLARVPASGRSALAVVCESLGQRNLARPFRWIPRPRLSDGEVADELARQAAYRRRFADALDETGLDALVCPASPTPAIPHGELYASFTLVYTGLYNLLGLPAGVVAASRVRAGEESDRPRSRDRVERALARIEDGSAGLPVGVQVVARPWREDVVLAVMGALERRFRASGDYPAEPLGSG